MGGLLYIITSMGSFAISHSGDITDTFDMALRYLMIAIPLGMVVFFSLRYFKKQDQRKRSYKLKGNG